MRRFGEWVREAPGAVGRLADAREVSEGLISLFGLCGLALAVLTLVWWYQAYSAIERTGASGRSWSAGWAIGGWFIPLGNLIIPKLVLDEIDRVSGAAESGNAGVWRDHPRLGAAAWWWGCFVAASVLVALGTSLTSEQLEQGLTSIAAYRRGLWLTSVGLGVDVAAALCATATLRILGGRLSR